MKQRILCPYCEGTGTITCGMCCGDGSVTAGRAGEGALAGMGGVDDDCDPVQCPTCGALGVVACVNCKGEGVTVPVVLQRKEINVPADEFDMAIDELGIAALAANHANRQARARLERNRAAAAKLLDEEKTARTAKETAA